MQLNFEKLKKKQRRIRPSFSELIGLRIHRCLSWLDRAEQEGNDYDAAFIFLWISFNAAYAEEVFESIRHGQRSAFLIPIFVDIMMDNHTNNWGLPYYPVVDKLV